MVASYLKVCLHDWVSSETSCIATANGIDSRRMSVEQDQMSHPSHPLQTYKTLLVPLEKYWIWYHHRYNLPHLRKVLTWLEQ